MRGEANHRVIASARFVREARTTLGFDLHDLGSFPAMVASGIGRVVGEVYEVDGDLLDRHDIFEGVPALYERHLVPLDDGGLVCAYLMSRSRLRRARRIESGSWTAWRKGNE